MIRKQGLKVVATSLLFTAVAIAADDCADCTKIFSTTRARGKAGGTLVFRQVVTEASGKPDANVPPIFFFDPSLPGLKRVHVGKALAPMFYEDSVANLYHRFPLRLKGDKPQEVLQRIRNGGDDGIYGEYSPIDVTAQRTLGSIFHERFKQFPDYQKESAARFLAGYHENRDVRTGYCAWLKGRQLSSSHCR